MKKKQKRVAKKEQAVKDHQKVKTKTIQEQ